MSLRNNSGLESSKYYFLGKGSADFEGGRSELVRDDDGERVVEDLPAGSREDEFAPRQIMKHSSQYSDKQRTSSHQSSSNENETWFSNLFSGGKKRLKKTHSMRIGEMGTLVKTRKAPIKVEPKVFFANERTFLAWMHLSVVLAGASIAILAFSSDNNSNSSTLSQLYGVILLPVAIAFIIYSMYQYSRRAYMIRNRLPGPYEDTVGPTVLGIMLMLSIVAQFALKLYALAAN